MLRAASVPPALVALRSLREEIRARLKAGTLLHASGRTWIQSAAGDHRCAACGKAIRARQPECKVEDRAEFHAHVSCFELWVEESRRPGLHQPENVDQRDHMVTRQIADTEIIRTTSSGRS